ncbi:dTMP kinase [bacterium]|nr:dTMP kinase [bacterium]
MKGHLISFEGIDGSGKTTQAELLYNRILNLGHTAHLFREPGGTPVGERIRSILLDASHSDMMPLAELFLYLAARVQITSRRIAPALGDGAFVIMDRYIDSSAAYQGYARGLGVDLVHHLNSIATGGLVPDITFFIDCDPLTALSRVSPTPDRLESEGLVFMERVRDGFRCLCQSFEDRFVLVDGNRSVKEIEETVFDEIRRREFLLK